MLCLVILLLLALAARLPNLATIPRFTDESLEVTWSLQIIRGEGYPLTNYDSYYGALFNYLVAGVFALFGPSAAAARAVVLAGGVLTVWATYLLGRAWAGRAGGLIAGLLLAVNGAHIAISSHIAWANCLTPLFTTLAIWALWRGADSPRLLLLAGLLFGLALQTHLLVVLFLPAAAAYVIWRRPGLFRTAWPYLGVAAFLVAYGNVIVHNLTNNFESLVAAGRIRREYAQDLEAASGYAPALASELLLLARVVAGTIDTRQSPQGFLLDPLLWSACGLALAGLIWQARRGNWLPAAIVLSVLVLLPIFNPKFRTLVSSRYVIPLLPILLAAIGGPLAESLRSFRGSVAPSAGIGQPASGGSPYSSGSRRWLGTTLALGVGAAMLVAPLLLLQRYYARATEVGETSERAYAFAGRVAEYRRPGEIVVLDESYGGETGSGVAELRALSYLLTLQDTPVKDLKLTPRRLEEELGDQPSLLTILTGRQLREMERLPLVPLGPPPDRPGAYGLFRLQRGAPMVQGS